MGKSLSHLSTEATQQTNVTGTLTPILQITPDNGVYLQFHNRVSQGSSQGLPVFMDLRDSGDNPMPTDTEVLFRVERPEDDDPSAVSVREYNIAAWNQLAIGDQRDKDNIDAVKFELTSRRINVRDDDVLTMEVDSSAQVDWSNSELYFAREGVEELPAQG